MGEWACAHFFCFRGHSQPIVSRSREDHRAHVRALAERVAGSQGLDVFDVQLRQESIGWVLRVILDRPGAAGAGEDGVSVDDCQRVSRDLETLLEVEDAFDHAYTLEVSSPGLDRPLRSLADYRRFVGRLAQVVVSEAVDGQQFLKGRIREVTDDAVLLDAGSRVHRVPFDAISRGRLEVEF